MSHLQTPLQATLHVRLRSPPRTVAYRRHRTLAPCGHTFDLACLKHHFLTALPSPRDARDNITDLVLRQKLCPVDSCRTEAIAEPARAPACQWAVKTIVAPPGASNSFGHLTGDLRPAPGA